MDYIGVRRVNPEDEHRRRGAPDRPVHVEGVHGAGHQDAAAAPQAGADPDGRGSDPGLARLQGGRRALRALPARTSCSRRSTEELRQPGRGSAAAREARRDPRVRPPGSLRAQRLASWSRCRATGSTPSCASGCRTCSSSGSTARRSTTTSRSARREIAQIHFTVHVEPGVQIPEVPLRGARGGGRASSRARGTTTCSTRSSRRVGAERGRVLAETLRGPVPRLLQGVDRVGADRRLTCSRCEELESNRRGVRRRDRQREREGERLTRVRLYKTGGKVDLSAFMPILESLGLRVVEEMPDHAPRRGATVFIHDFGVLGRARRGARRSRRPADRVARMRSARCGAARRESDSLNRLVDRSPGSTWRQVQILRARTASTAMRVIVAASPSEYQNDAFAAHPHIAAQLVRLFEMRSSIPARPRDRRGRRARSATQILRGPATRCASLDQDRILRNAARARSTRRCGRTPTSRSPLDRASSCARADVPEMPKPHPLFEIFVYSPRDGGHPPARRAWSRAAASAGPTGGGLPHRGPRPDEGADGQERRHRARPARRAASS